MTHRQQKAFENIVGKEEIAHNEQFLLFPQCFLLNPIIVSPFVHIYDIISLFATELEKSKIGISSNGLIFISDDFQQKFVDEVFTGLVKMLQHVKVSAYGRDAAMELLIKLVTRKSGLHWTKQFLDTDGNLYFYKMTKSFDFSKSKEVIVNLLGTNDGRRLLILFQTTKF